MAYAANKWREKLRAAPLGCKKFYIHPSRDILEAGAALEHWLYKMYNLYDMSLKFTISTARAQFADLVNHAEYAGERTVLHRRNKPVAAVVPIEDLKRLERLEDEIDLAAARKAMKEKGKSIPWSQVKKDLNL